MGQSWRRLWSPRALGGTLGGAALSLSVQGGEGVRLDFSRVIGAGPGSDWRVGGRGIEGQVLGGCQVP